MTNPTSYRPSARLSTRSLLPLVLVALSGLSTVACGGSSRPQSDSSSTGTIDPTCTETFCPGDCGDDGWCLMDKHLGAFYVAIWASAADDIWVAEQNGMVRRGAGASWTVPIPDATSVTAMWGKSPDEVWVAAGNGHVVRWNGSAWIPEPILDGAPVGFQAFLYDKVTDELLGVDETWLYVHTPEGWKRRDDLPNATRPARAVSSCAGAQWFAMGEVATIRDGHLRAYGVPYAATLNSALTLAPGLHLAAGTHLLVNDGQWGAAPFFDPIQNAKALAATSLDDIYAVNDQNTVYRWDGGSWKPIHTAGGTPGIAQIYTETPGEVLVTIDNGATQRVVVGGSGPELLVGVPPSSTTFDHNKVFYASSSELYSSNSGLFLRWTAGGGASWSDVGDAPSDATALWVFAPNNAWFVDGSEQVYRWAGGVALETVDTGLALAGAKFQAIWASGPDDMWLAGLQHVIQWNGAAWIDHSAKTTAEVAYDQVAITGSGPKDIWILRKPNRFHHFDGATWTAKSPTPSLVDLACDKDGLVALGSQPLGIYRGEPGAMSPFSSVVDDYSAELTWMGGPENVWVLGHHETATERIRHFDGATWTVSWADPQLVLSALYGLPDGRMLAAGGPNVIVRAP